MIKKFIAWLYKRTHNDEKLSREYTIDPGYYGIKTANASMIVPSMPKALEGFSVKDILDASAAINSSRAIYTINSIIGLTDSKTVLKDWEIKLVQDAYAQFSAKYCSPLSEALR